MIKKCLVCNSKRIKEIGGNYKCENCDFVFKEEKICPNCKEKNSIFLFMPQFKISCCRECGYRFTEGGKEVNIF
mgnify:CR=1 FL=1